MSHQYTYLEASSLALLSENATSDKLLVLAVPRSCCKPGLRQCSRGQGPSEGFRAATSRPRAQRHHINMMARFLDLYEMLGCFQSLTLKHFRGSKQEMAQTRGGSCMRLACAGHTSSLTCCCCKTAVSCKRLSGPICLHLNYVHTYIHHAQSDPNLLTSHVAQTLHCFHMILWSPSSTAALRCSSTP